MRRSGGLTNCLHKFIMVFEIHAFEKRVHCRSGEDRIKDGVILFEIC